MNFIPTAVAAHAVRRLGSFMPAGRSSGLFLVACALLYGLAGCSRREPIEGFWNYPWGTTCTAVLADTAQIRARFGRSDFKWRQDTLRLVLSGAQYGLGYARLTLDFTAEGKLWHGAVRIPIDSPAAPDSVLEDLRRRFGREKSPGRFEASGGSATVWQSRDWLDRDYFAAQLEPKIDRGRVRAIDFHSVGCLTDCPIFSIRLLGTGDAYFWSVQGLEQAGGFRGRFDPAQFAAFAARVTEPWFLALAESYGYGGADLPRRAVRVDFGGFARVAESVVAAGPPELERLLDSLAARQGRIPWTQIVSWDTVRVLDFPRIQLDSLEALGPAFTP